MNTNAISFTDPEIQKCPFHAYEATRSASPAYRDPVGGFFIVTDYEHVRAVAQDTATFSSETGLMFVKDSVIKEKIDAIWRENGVMPVNTMVVKDDPEHKFHRSLVDKAFNPVRMRQMEDYLESIVDSMIDAFIDEREVDFHNRMSVLVPLSVIADQLGVPRSNMAKFKFWSDTVMKECDQSNSPEAQIAITYDMCEFQRYVIEKAKEYKAQPRECMLSDMVNADVDGRKLSMEELVAIVAQILTAGNETTAAAMSSAMIRLIEQPGLEQQLRDNPKLIPQFVEEVLRLDSPIQGLFRRATRDTEIGGVPITEGSIVVIKWAAANRDPAQFANPNAVDLERSNSRQHTAFGYGPHFCIGNQLARGELRIALTELLKRMKNFRYARGEASSVRHAHYFSYSVAELHIAFDRI
jgi:cytochrome P450